MSDLAARPRRVSIRPALLLLLILLVAVVGLSTGMLALRNGQRAVDELIHQMLNEVTSRINDSLYTYLKASQDLLQINDAALHGEHIDVKNFGRWDGQKQRRLEVEHFFWRELHQSPQVNYVYMANEQGDFFGVVRRQVAGTPVYFAEVRKQGTGGLLYTYRLDEQGERQARTQTGHYDPRQRPWYKAARADRSRIWSDVYGFASKPILGLTAVRQLYDRAGRLQAVLAADTILTNFSRFMSALKIGQTGRAFVTERNGLLIATSSSEPLSRKKGAGLERIRAEDSNDDVTHRAARSIEASLGSLAAVDRPYQLTYEANEDRYLVQVTPLAGDLGLDWLIFVVLPERDFMGHIRANTRWTIAFCLLAATLASLLGIFFAGRLVTPLQRLARYTRELVSRDFKSTPEVKAGMQAIAASRWDEVADLSESIAYMEDELQDYIVKVQEASAARERVESELRVGRKIQMSVLPQKFPPFPNRQDFELHAQIEPAKEMSGDFYDYYLINEHRLYFTIGDVSGKGVPASLFMVTARTLLEAAANELDAAHEILAMANRELRRRNKSRTFVTVFYGILDLRTGVVTYANAGHNPPYLLRSNGTIESLERAADPVLGVMPGVEYSLGTLTLAPGDAMFLYTDGVTEAMDLQDNQFTPERLETLLQRDATTALDALIEKLVAEVKAFAGDAPQSDDITVLAVRYRGAEA